MTDEFDIIHRYFQPLTRGHAGAFALSDDAATLPVRAGFEHVITTDAIVQGVHFLTDEAPENIATRLCTCNLSDLASMGARPLGFTLACVWSRETDIDFIAAFAEGLGASVDAHDFPLLGGDTVTTPGPMMFSLTAIGEVEVGRALRRNGASPGDTVYVSGSIGDGALGLLAAEGKLGNIEAGHRKFLEDRYRRPTPRIATGRSLIGQAHACIDISDGLVQDLGHICETSSVSMRIEAAKIPLSAAARAAITADPALLDVILSGGDDYELAFTGADITGLDVPVTAIGTVLKGKPGVAIIGGDGQAIRLAKSGYNHFSA
ncbi:MAG: thiamine-phosphate kinase [Rhodospirillales bacterium]